MWGILTAAPGSPAGRRRIWPGSRLFAGLRDGTRFYFVHSYAPEPGGDAVAAV